MEELVPVVLGAVLGVPISLAASRRLRFALSAAAVLLSGLAATILSGEYRESWVYLLLDLGEAALGLAFGLLVGGRIGWRRAAAPLRGRLNPLRNPSERRLGVLPAGRRPARRVFENV